jgi:hypothetical protein
LHNRKIQDAMGVAQGGLHSIKVKKMSSMVMKLNLAKDYDRVRYIYPRLMLLHTRMSLHVITRLWVLSSIFFVVFINGP